MYHLLKSYAVIIPPEDEVQVSERSERVLTKTRILAMKSKIVATSVVCTRFALV